MTETRQQMVDRAAQALRDRYPGAPFDTALFPQQVAETVLDAVGVLSDYDMRLLRVTLPLARETRALQAEIEELRASMTP